ncbi:uncharacterized protein L969DRAFT_323365 [Mixia osmundae IAM 14324]|uniref:Uncharacterized protein n=1 Tax=Mixia osmundae (strain CBS 9802 / IAM 14324 / JCM 22182 / KY 12970) TaxID=764103 RepID=G7DTT1_MIXOS|nr:uncharacterized protein L969DRAFT_323365 [Mixia osmundae IAM 14324]KEI41706.1 hypothetical protein L969DRAFT_323365 [Mixia osmundae IAM 14324]GAA93991.1 hypothetical protein E5Q_00638 [Mixia osmundae IAM 14324]
MSVALPTALTRLLGCRLPFVGAAMAGAAGSRLAAAVSRAGGFGFMSMEDADAAKMQEEYDHAAGLLGSSKDQLPIGNGFTGFKLDVDEPASRRKLTVSAQRCRAIWLSFGNDLEPWIRFLREPQHPRVIIFVLVTNTADAAKAADLPVDVIIAQGSESGGHGSSVGLPNISLLPEVIDTVKSNKKYDQLVLAAGGIVTASQVLSMLALGADGIVLGTALVATHESLYSDAQKELMINSHGTETTRTMVYDVMRGTTSWPKQVDGRGIMNVTYKELQAGRSEDDVKADYQEAVKSKDASRLVCWSGTSVGLIKRVSSAEDFVAQLGKDTLEQWNALQGRLQWPKAA